MAVPVILGPSLGTDADWLWGEAASLLGPGSEPVLFSLPGHGPQGLPVAATVGGLADEVIRFADARGIARFDFAGVSLSGAIGIELALRWPDRVRSLAVICSAARIGTPGGWRERADDARADRLAPRIPALVERWFGRAHLGAHPGDAADAAAYLARIDREVYGALCDALGEFDRVADIERISMPLLVLEGREDPVIPVAGGRELAERATRGRLLVLEGIAHLAPREAPAATARALRRLVAEAD